MRPPGIIAAVVVLLSVLAAPGAYCAPRGEIVLWGDDTDRPASNATNYNPTSAEIKVNAVVFFEIRTPAAGYTVAERESIVLKRIIEIFSRGKIEPVYVGSVRGRPTIYVDRVRLVTVYPEDVIAAGAPSARELAERWAVGVQKGLLLTAPSSCFGGPPSYTVAIGGKVFFRLVDPAGYATVRDRGRAVDGQLALAISEFQPGNVATVHVPEGIAVMVGGRTVVVAMPGDARPRGTSVNALAGAWADNLRRLMPLVKDGIAPMQAGSGAAG